MTVSVEHLSITSLAADAVVVNLFKGVVSPSGATGAADAALGGEITRLIEGGDFKGKLGETAVLYTAGRLAAPRVIIVGLGPKDDFGLEEVRRAAAKAVKKAQALGVKRLATIVHGAGAGGLDAAHAAQATAEGSLLAAYRFDTYRTKDRDNDSPAVHDLVLAEADEERLAAVRQGAATAAATVAGVSLARDLGNHPGNTATPVFLADQATQLAERYGMHSEVWDRDRIVAEGMGALASVNSGSEQPPRFIIVEHAPTGSQDGRPYVLAGKAVTFDTGGISLKGGLGMAKMKFDMCGGAAVLGALEAVGRLQLPVRVVGLIGATDNMPDGKATRPGDVVTALNGKTIEVINTDAEGRLVLADALSYAARLAPKPRAVVDLATLTGAMIVSLGHAAAGMFANDDGLSGALATAGEATGERLWRLPLWKVYGRSLKGDVADLRNTVEKRPSPAGAIFAAKFLEEFVDYPWAHLDIAGVAWESEDVPYVAKGATGFGVRLLVEWLRSEAGSAGDD